MTCGTGTSARLGKGCMWTLPSYKVFRLDCEYTESNSIRVTQYAVCGKVAVNIYWVEDTGSDLYLKHNVSNIKGNNEISELTGESDTAQSSSIPASSWDAASGIRVAK